MHAYPLHYIIQIDNMIETVLEKAARKSGMQGEEVMTFELKQLQKLNRKEVEFPS